jgi:hypothetical protein
MPTKTRSDNTSEASPGQSDKRDQLLRIYDELDDIRKIPGARLIVIQGMGHDLPEGVWPTVIDATVAQARG